MNFHEAMEQKKQWRQHMARVKALPNDYQIVYQEIQKYLFKVGPVDVVAEGGILYELVDLFEDGANNNKGVREIVGQDVAAFVDSLIEDVPTYADYAKEISNEAVQKSYETYKAKEAKKNK